MTNHGLRFNSIQLSTRPQHKPRMLTLQMAGATGIEPVNAGIKIQCLTAWRRPYFICL